LKLIHSARFYKASGAKLIFRRVIRRLVQPENTWRYLRESQVRVIWLYRENSLAAALSSRLKVHRKHDGLRAHSPTKRPTYRLCYQSVVRALGVAEEWKNRMLDSIDGGLVLTYEDIKGDDDSTKIPKGVSHEICDFLDVRRIALETGIERACKGGHKQYIKNWPQIKTFVVEAGYERYLEGIT